MKYLDWNEDKNQELRAERDVSFEDVVVAVEEGKIFEIVEHSNQKKHPNQRILIIEINSYAYLIPFVEDESKIFFKTIIPSRKATKKYIIDRR